MLKLLPKSSKILSTNWIAKIIATLLLIEWNLLDKRLKILLNLCVSIWITCLLEKENLSIDWGSHNVSKALTVPVQLGPGIQMYQHFPLWFLIDSLNKHEFCVSYSEALKYENCAAVHQGTKISGMSESSSAKPTYFMHHVAGNADHNSRALDGRNAFHGMGIIYCCTCGFVVLHHTTFRKCVNRRWPSC